MIDCFFNRAKCLFVFLLLLNISFNSIATAEADEVVITGVFDKRKLESSVAISTVNSKQMSQLAPASAAYLLKNVPGVYVNDGTLFCVIKMKCV